MNRGDYEAQVALLLNCLPALKAQSTFALKGGTAINFFIRDFPRLSVDIDLTYVSTNQRQQAIAEIQRDLEAMGNFIVKHNKRYYVKPLKTREGLLHKIIIANDKVQIKIEPNFIMRGTLLPIKKMPLTKEIENRFEYAAKDIPILDPAELYAGKICAALSRQHPRDFFDIKILLENDGITDATRQAFVIYLACSPRPMHELLSPNLISLNSVYENEFINMTEQPVTLDELLLARGMLITKIHQTLTDNEKQFLLSIKLGEPDYSLMPFDHLDKLPALNWKLINVRKMEKKKHEKMLGKLKEALEI
jgi:predicted nucleotidyltransferase component of viral defense system